MPSEERDLSIQEGYTRTQVAWAIIYNALKHVWGGVLYLWEDVAWQLIGKISRPRHIVSFFFSLLAPLQVYFFVQDAEYSIGLDYIAATPLGQAFWIFIFSFLGYATGNIEKPIVHIVGALVIIRYSFAIAIGIGEGGLNPSGLLGILYLFTLAWAIAALVYLNVELVRLKAKERVNDGSSRMAGSTG